LAVVPTRFWLDNAIFLLHLLRRRPVLLTEKTVRSRFAVSPLPCVRYERNQQNLHFLRLTILSSVTDPWHLCVDTDPNPRIQALTNRTGKKYLFKRYGILLIFFEGTFIRNLSKIKRQKVTKQ
jgi:hypothetical protein